MNPDRSWMYKTHINGYLNPDFITGIDKFIDFACSNPSFMEGQKIRCPCDRCKHSFFRDVWEVKLHIQKRGFTSEYYVWNRHGEIYDHSSPSLSKSFLFPNTTENDQPYNSYRDFETYIFGPSHEVHQSYTSFQEPTIDVASTSQNIGYQNPYREMVMNAAGPEYEPPSYEEQLPNPSAQKWYDMLRASEQPLYDGCETYSQLGITADMLNAKSEFNMSESLYDRMCGVIKRALSEGNTMPDSFYSTKKLVRDLGLPYEKIHCCINGCMLYWGNDSSLRNCKFCTEKRYKELKNGYSKRRKEVPVKMMYYFPITERLQRLYASKATASHMRWHAEHDKEDGVMIHCSDSEAWKHFDRKNPSFASETRNIRLGLCTDGFQPFGQTGGQYSSWPVILTPYNLPPWLCMETPYMFLTIIVPGPRNPKQNIDVFLQPLVEELCNLWYEGVWTWDISTKTNFEMRAALMWTISDFPAYSMLSGWSTAGKLACPVCMEDSQAFQLVHGGKTSWFDTHRKFLPTNHIYRKDKNNFRKNEVCSRVNRPIRTGEEILSHIDAMGLKKVTEIGWEQKNAKIAKSNEGCGWKKRSILWDLPYWKHNLIRHNLDVMHIEKNFFDNIFNTIMNVDGKSKDNFKAREDMQKLCRRKKLAEKDPRTGKYMKATYQLDPKGKEAICNWVKTLKFPDGFVSKLARCVDMSKHKLFGMKSHDCHVFLQRLLPIAFRELLPDKEWRALTEVSIFFRKLTATTLKEADMKEMVEQIPVIICNLEKIFPPSFFDPMEHLPIHLPYEALVAGPVQYRWMYPFERFLGHLKKKVGNKDRVEAFICNSYIVEESSTFCSYYFEPEVQCRYRKVPRNDAGEMPEMVDGEMTLFAHPGRAFGRRRTRYLEEREKLVAHTYILLNCPAVKPYIDIFIAQVEQENPQRNDAEGVNWKKVPQSTKDWYWGEYLRYTTHVGFDKETVFKAWKTTAQVRYKDWISALSKLSTKPDGRGIPDSNWAAWTRYWKTDEFKILSARGSTNQDRQGKGKNIHTGSSETFSSKLKKMWAKNEYPDPTEFHKLTHTRKNQPGIFCDDHASKVHAEYVSKEKEMLLQVQSQAEVDGSSVPDSLSLAEKSELFKEVAGGVKKGGAVYGSGSVVDQFYHRERRAPSSSVSQSSSAEEVLKLQEKVKYLEEIVARGKEERDQAIAKAVSDAIRQTVNSVEDRVFKKVKKMMKNDHRRRFDHSESEASSDDC